MTDAWAEPSRRWASGRWSLDLRDGGELADIRHQGRTVLRAVQAVVRDHDWNTASLVVDEVQATDEALTLDVRSVGLGSSFEGTLTVDAQPTILTVRLDLVSRHHFDTNRTGLVVLLPPDLASTPAVLRHPDGSEERTSFPVAISPHQPMRDVAAISWWDDDRDLELVADGDVFEMEDQRNWTDASFKLYSRPLAEPFPYRVAAGERVTQSIALTAERSTDAGSGPSTPDDRARIVLLPTGDHVPEIVLGASTAPDPGPARSDEESDPRRNDSRGPARRPESGLSTINVAALLVELDLTTPNWRAALTRAAASGLPLDVRAITDGTLDDLAEALADVTVARIGVFDPADHVTHHDAVDQLRRAFPETTVVGGARSHFTELNREQHRVPLTGLDGVTFSVTPLFHATSTAQLVESVAMQRLVAQQAVAIAGGTPVHIGPVTLRPRFNNVATAPAPAPTRDDLAEGYGAAFTGSGDARQSSPELAAWTIASAAALAVPGVASIAFFEEWGPRGIRSSADEPYPVAAAIAALASLGGDLLTGDSPDGLVWAVGAGDAVLVANLDDRPRTVLLSTAAGIAEASVPALSWTHLKEPT